MTNRLDEHRVARHIKDVSEYAERYKCSLVDAFRDWICEEPTDRDLAFAVAEKVFKNLSSNQIVLECIERNCVDIAVVNEYYREQY